MRTPRSAPGGLRGLLILAFLNAAGPALLAAKVLWEPVPKADLESKQCEKYPGVAAEELFKHQSLDADSTGAWNEYYLRRKVYNATAAQASGLLNIEYESNHTLRYMAARVVKADGQILELGAKDFTDNVVAKVAGVKFKSKSIAVPNLEAGDIVEYQWAEPTSPEYYQPQTWFIQSVYPTRLFTFTLHRSSTDVNVMWFNVDHAVASEVKGNKVLTVTDVPPWEAESYTPPERDLRGSVVVVATGTWARWWGKKDLWQGLSTEWAEEFRLDSQPNAEIKKAAREAIGDATTNADKLTRLYQLVQGEITNLEYFDNAELQAFRKKLPDAGSEQLAGATWKNKIGYGTHVNAVFAALCTAAGFEAHMVWGSSRADTTDVQNDQGFIFLNYPLVAVKVGEGWQYFRPADYFVPAGMVDWRFESAPGLLCLEDAKEVYFAKPAPAPAAASELHRVGTFTLNPDGDCEGTVKIEYTGHYAVEKKHLWSDKTTEELAKLVRDEVAERLPNAELSDFRFENIGGTGQPTTVSYRMKLPGYAEAAGDRLIFATGLFEKGSAPLFKSSTRKWPVSFPFAYHVRDEITFQLPATFVLDAPSAPASFGKDDDPYRCRYKIALHKTHHTVSYARDLIVADQGVLTLPAANYPAIKRFFDRLLNSDSHTLVIKPAETPGPAPAPAPADASPPADKGTAP